MTGSMKGILTGLLQLQAHARFVTTLHNECAWAGQHWFSLQEVGS